MIFIYRILLYLTGTLSLINVVLSTGLDLSICTKNFETCQCGESNGYPFNIYVKGCTFLKKWKTICKPCDEIKKEVRCAPYRSCEECDPKLDRCVRCPPSKYGKWCTIDCKCKNGGTCEQDSGRCVCPSKWQGPTCEQSTETVCPNVGDLNNGMIKITGEGGPQAYLAGAELEFNCKPLHYMFGQRKATCLSNGIWSASKPRCIKLLTCTSVEPIANGIIEIIQSSPRTSEDYRGGVLPNMFTNGHYYVGTRAVFSCESQYYQLIGSKVRTCENSGQWSGKQPKCIPICGRSSGPKVSFNTQETASEIGQWPWQVGLAFRSNPGSLDEGWDLYCGGSLISERWVVTSAHCVTYKNSVEAVPAKEIRLYFGKYYRDNKKDDNNVKMRKVKEIHVHEDYEPTSLESDIALLRLNTPVVFSSRVQPVCLPDNIDESNSRLKEGNLGVATGWAETEKGNYSEVLQQIKLPVVTNKQCEADYKKINLSVIVTGNMLCAGYEKGSPIPCSGFGGGPFVFPLNKREDEWVLEGVNSWGSILGCGSPHQPNGYVRVVKFYQWIFNFI